MRSQANEMRDLKFGEDESEWDSGDDELAATGAVEEDTGDEKVGPEKE